MFRLIMRYISSGDTSLIYAAIAFLISSVIIVFVASPFHEFSHAFIAYKLGDNTAKYEGRLTLNPFAHIDWIGATLILLFGFGWARPVPVNPNNFRYTKVGPKGGMALSALAGPVSNILMALVFALLKNLVFTFVTLNAVTYYVYLVFTFAVEINVTLAVFNLIPIPPLDGSKILFAVLPSRYYFGYMRYERYISFVLIALVVSGFLNLPLSYATSFVSNGINFVADLPFKLLGAL